MFDWLKRWRERDRDIQAELDYHVEMLAQDQIDRGNAPEAAQFAARRKFGNLTLAKENTRAVWIGPAVEAFLQDLRYAARTLLKSPGFALTAILSLALGIGANTAIFSLINALLLRMLPVPDPQRLVELVTISKQDGKQLDSLPYPAIKGLEKSANLFSGICGFTQATFHARLSGEIQPTSGAWVTGEYYGTLGVQAAVGRVLKPEDDTPGAQPVAVLSYSYWNDKFHRDAEIPGKQILIDGTPVMIVGVSVAGFDGATIGIPADITLPLASLRVVFPEHVKLLAPGAWWLRVLARPKPGVSSAQAEAQLAALWPGITKELAASIRSPFVQRAVLASSIDLVPGGTGWTYLRHTFKRPLMVLMALVGFVLLLACANVANLLLTRATARAREFGVRVAIGAGRWRLVRQLLTESTLLAVLGAGLGIVFAFAGDQVLIHVSSARFEAQGVPLILDVQPDARVLAFTVSIAILTGLLFGLAPAFYAAGSGPGATSKDTHAKGWRRSWLSSTLIVLQMAFSLLLLVGAGLFVRTLEHLENVPLGFHHEGVLLVNFDPIHLRYTDAQLASLYRELMERIGRTPGVQSVSLSDNTPLSGGIWADPILVDEQPPQHGSGQTAHFNSVSPSFFATLQTPLLRGRDFNNRDNPASQLVAIVNQEFVHLFLHGVNPLGHRVSSLDSPDLHDMQIVGVVQNTISADLRESPPPFVYLPYFQEIKDAPLVTFEIRAKGSLASAADAIQLEIHNQLPDTALTIVPFTKQVQDSLTQERLMATLASFFGAVALALAAIGLYGIMAYTVTRRTSEIGVRMALGASRGNVLGLILRGAFILVGAGVAVGLPVALGSSKFVSKMLFGIRPADPVTAVAAAGLLFIAALIAAYVPARRAARVDPLKALRYE